MTAPDSIPNNTYNARNLVGYGETPPDPKWPGNAKVAISFVLNYEEGAESSVEEGDKGPEFILVGIWRLVVGTYVTTVPLTVLAPDLVPSISFCSTPTL